MKKSGTKTAVAVMTAAEGREVLASVGTMQEKVARVKACGKEAWLKLRKSIVKSGKDSQRFLYVGRLAFGPSFSIRKRKPGTGAGKGKGKGKGGAVKGKGDLVAAIKASGLTLKEVIDLAISILS